MSLALAPLNPWPWGLEVQIAWFPAIVFEASCSFQSTEEEKLPSVIKQKQAALEKKIAKESRAKRLDKKRRETAMKGFKLRRFKKVQESRKKKPKSQSKFPKTFRATKKRLSPIKESPKSSSPREYKSSADKEILAGLERSLQGLKISK